MQTTPYMLVIGPALTLLTFLKFFVGLGLKVNFHKSHVFGIRVPNTKVASCVGIFGCKVASFPFTYLGVPIGANMALKWNWNPIIYRVQNRLLTWKSKTLSFKGCLTFVKLGSMPLFYFSLFKAAMSVLNDIERICRHFCGVASRIKTRFVGLIGRLFSRTKKNAVWVWYLFQVLIFPSFLNGFGDSRIKTLVYRVKLLATYTISRENQ